MELYNGDEGDAKQMMSRSFNLNPGYGRTPIDIDVQYRDTRRRGFTTTTSTTAATNDSSPRRRRRAHHFGALSVLFLLGLVYCWRSGRFALSSLGGVRHETGIAGGGGGCAGSTDVKPPRYNYPAGVTPAVAAILPSFNWTAHQPSKELNWTECYDKFFCARLTVPLDYSEPNGEQAAVALIKYPSPYPSSHKKYKGPILFNPGGPGGSGVSLILGGAEMLRVIVGDEFDLVGFDPRGVLFTTPQLNIFKTAIEAARFLLELPTNLNASSAAFGEIYARAKVQGLLAEKRDAKYAAHVSTPTVATDMLSIIKAAGYDKLQYWGFSYGSVLGATFAAMYPDNVGRLIIDGVEDSEDYYAGLWSNNLRDTDAALFDIYEACARAGPNDPCPLHEDSAALIAERVDKLIARIKEEPLPVYIPEQEVYGIVDYAIVKELILRTLYTTHGGGGKRLMLALHQIENGDGAAAYTMSYRHSLESLVSCGTCPTSGGDSRPIESSGPIFSIACGDAPSVEKSLDEARAFYHKMAEDSTFADAWPIHLACTGWKVRAKDRFKGSFEQNTSYPLLVIGNTADPVTPLWNAHKMASGFKDAVVLQQNTSGHCSIAASSLCTFKAIKSYFQKGILPKKGTVCQAESSIYAGTSEVLESLTVEDRLYLDAAHELQQMQLIPPLGASLWGIPW